MRTTISLDDDLLAEAKQVAARTGRTLTAVIEDALRASLHRRHVAPTRPVELPIFGEGGVQPGVDLDDSAALLELLERGDETPDDAAPRR
jgi:Bacterial antitoxin of type II TA system, VapB